MRSSDRLEEYVVYIEGLLLWSCDRCGHNFEEAAIAANQTEFSGDSWAIENAQMAIDAGWFVPPKDKEGKYAFSCLCPSCAAVTLKAT